MANGPSLSLEQVQHVRAAGPKVIAINAAYQIAPWADIVYGADPPFWRAHAGELRGMPCLRVCGGDDGDVRALIAQGVVDLRLEVHGDPALAKFEVGATQHGQHSGYQALEMAIALIRRRGRVILLGYDCRTIGGRRNSVQKAPELERDSPYQRWPEQFARMPIPEGVEIVNCSPGSAITAFRAAELTDVLR